MLHNRSKMLRPMIGVRESGCVTGSACQYPSMRPGSGEGWRGTEKIKLRHYPFLTWLDRLLTCAALLLEPLWVPFTDLSFHRQRLVVAPDLHADALARAKRADEIDHVVLIANGLVFHLHDHVVGA